jgi:hypothetical protein
MSTCIFYALGNLPGSYALEMELMLTYYIQCTNTCIYYHTSLALLYFRAEIWQGLIRKLFDIENIFIFTLHNHCMRNWSFIKTVSKTCTSYLVLWYITKRLFPKWKLSDFDVRGFLILRYVNDRRNTCRSDFLSVIDDYSPWYLLMWLELGLWSLSCII